MSLPAEHLQLPAEQLEFNDSIRLLRTPPPGLRDTFEVKDPQEIALRQNELNSYINFRRGILWDVPLRFSQHPDAARFRRHGDKSESQQEMEIVGHAILDWQFDGGEKRIMRIASYASGHHPDYGVLITNGMCLKQDDNCIGKETVMERTVYFNLPEYAQTVNDFRVPTGFKIVDDRFVTRYPKEIEKLLKTYSSGFYQKNPDAVRWARNEAKDRGYDFEFYYGHPRVVIPGSAVNYPLAHGKSYF